MPNSIKVSKSSFPPAAADTVVHVEAFGYALSLRVPRLVAPTVAVRSAERLAEIKAAL